uniref:solute carrier family 3 member 2b isoform X2 n=1 Tax=Pristiophorus japonicus TaxID=55135 RepID=UPI00398F85F6
MSGKDMELGLKDVELNEVEQEKAPMNAGGGGLSDTNGAVKVKLEEPPVKFTGLSKEQLLEVANTPGWVRARWALLILFWLGWLGMLAGAIAIIVQAPRCKPLPSTRWWQQGGLYRVAVEAFQDSDHDGKGDLAGVGERMEEIAALKVKAIMIGPIHHNIPNWINETRLTEIDRDFGTLEQLEKLMESARRKGIKVILDLTPNYRGQEEWFGINFNKSEGSQTLLQVPARLDEWRNLTRNFSDDQKPRTLIIGTASTNLHQVLQVLNNSDTDLLFSYYLGKAIGTPSANIIRQNVEKYIESCGKTWPSWAVGGYRLGHMASLVKEHLWGLVHVMLFTLPGTPFINYGDEIGLEDTPGLNKLPWMLWNSSANGGFTSKSSQQEAPDPNLTVEGQKSNKTSSLSLFKKLSLLKIKQRSLQFGEFQSVYSESGVFAYSRVWDQSERFLVVLNFGTVAETVALTASHLPAEAAVELSTSAERTEGTKVSLAEVRLAAGEGLVLKFSLMA